MQHETHVLTLEATVEEPVIHLDHDLEEVTKVTIEDIESMKAALFVLQKHHLEFPLTVLSASFSAIELPTSSG